MMGKKSKEDVKFEYRFKLGAKHKLSVSIFKNQNDEVVLNLRKFYLADEDEDVWRPDKQGLTMHLEQSGKLMKAIKKLEEVAEDAPEPEFGKKSKGKKKKSKNDDDDE